VSKKKKCDRCQNIFQSGEESCRIKCCHGASFLWIYRHEVLIPRRRSFGDQVKASMVNCLGLGWGVRFVEGGKGPHCEVLFFAGNPGSQPALPSLLRV